MKRDATSHRQFKKRLNFGRPLWTTALVVAASVGATAFAADRSPAIRSDAERAFAQLSANSVDAMQKTLAFNKSGAKDFGAAKFHIVGAVSAPTQAPQKTETTTSNETTASNETKPSESETKLGIKVWFELADGSFVNPTQRRWNRKERFYIHVQAAVPIYVALYQNFADQTPKSREVYPSSEYKESYLAIQPGESKRLPVLFELDDSDVEEVMSMVVVRADWGPIQNGLTKPAVASVAAVDSSAQVTAQANAIGAGTMKCFNERVVSNENLSVGTAKAFIPELSDEKVDELTKSINAEAGVAKFGIVGPQKENSSQPNDVCFYMFGEGYVGQWQLTIKK